MIYFAVLRCFHYLPFNLPFIYSHYNVLQMNIRYGIRDKLSTESSMNTSMQPNHFAYTNHVYIKGTINYVRYLSRPFAIREQEALQLTSSSCNQGSGHRKVIQSAFCLEKGRPHCRRISRSHHQDKLLLSRIYLHPAALSQSPAKVRP